MNRIMKESRFFSKSLFSDTLNESSIYNRKHTRTTRKAHQEVFFPIQNRLWRFILIWFHFSIDTFDGTKKPFGNKTRRGVRARRSMSQTLHSSMALQNSIWIVFLCFPLFYFIQWRNYPMKRTTAWSILLWMMTIVFFSWLLISMWTLLVNSPKSPVSGSEDESDHHNKQTFMNDVLVCTLWSFDEMCSLGWFTEEIRGRKGGVFPPFYFYCVEKTSKRSIMNFWWREKYLIFFFSLIHRNIIMSIWEWRNSKKYSFCSVFDL